jgi:hypothetical protein
MSPAQDRAEDWPMFQLITLYSNVERSRLMIGAEGNAP